MTKPTREEVRDASALAGVALIGAGLWWMYPPAALIVVGAMVLLAALWGHFHAAE